MRVISSVPYDYGVPRLCGTQGERRAERGESGVARRAL
ncbi:MAG: hypothetical protein RI897_3495 [Verrucomicrobiota bacterium]|jgi:hypothetical protein